MYLSILIKTIVIIIIIIIQIRTLLYMITHNTYSTQLFQLRFKVLPQLSGKVENERERLN